jgi:hypothetical protein
MRIATATLFAVAALVSSIGLSGSTTAPSAVRQTHASAR